MYLFFIMSLGFIALGVIGLSTGRVLVTHNRTLKKFYKKEENPKLFYSFVVLYFFFGFVVIAYGFSKL